MAQAPKVGVAVSTTGTRNDFLAKTIEAFLAYPPDFFVVTLDEEMRGVAWNKNQGLKAMMDAGCTHLFLVDDDVRPTTSTWAEAYTSHDLPHLTMAHGTDRYSGEDPIKGLTYWTIPSGTVLYYTREAIEVAGYFREEMGRFGYEHTEHSHRIANFYPELYNRLHPFTDIKDSLSLWDMEDFKEDGSGRKSMAERSTFSTFSEEERDFAAARRLYNHFKKVKAHVPFPE